MLGLAAETAPGKFSLSWGSKREEREGWEAGTALEVASKCEGRQDRKKTGRRG